MRWKNEVLPVSAATDKSSEGSPELLGNEATPGAESVPVLAATDTQVALCLLKLLKTSSFYRDKLVDHSEGTGFARIGTYNNRTCLLG